MCKNELLSLFMVEERVFMLENTALNDSFDYFVDKYKRRDLIALQKAP